MAPKLSQEEFDEAVQTNIEDFDMEADEAVASALEEFKLQGYNLDGIVKSASGGKTDSHPVAIATRDVSHAAAAAGEGGGSASDIGQLQQTVSALQQQFKGLSGGDLQQALAVANKEGAVAALLAATKAAAMAGDTGSSDAATAASLLVACLRALRVLMQLADCRAAFISRAGPQLLLDQLQGCWDQLAGPQQEQQQQQQYQLAAAVASLAEAAAWQDEEAKCAFMQNGFAAAALRLLQHVSSSPATLQDTPAARTAAAAAAGALRAFTTADDDRPAASKAFLHARQLAGPPHHALAVLLPVLRQLAGMQPELPVGALTAVLGAVRQIAANEDICKSFAEAGGVSALQALLSAASEAGGPPELVRSTAGALRQLANSDGVKAQLAEQGLLPVLLRAVRVYGPQQPSVQEQLLGLLAAMVLRMPDIAAAAADAGAIDVLTEVLTAAPAMAAAAAKAKADAATARANGSTPAAPSSTDTATGHNAAAVDEELASRVFGVGIGSNGGSNGGSTAAAAAAVQRQACMAVRNMVVRNPELRPLFLAAGAEGLLRGVKGVFPGACKDVGAAALRDLGLDNYQD